MSDAASSPAMLVSRIAAAARQLGFARVGFTTADRLEQGAAALAEWLAHGYAGEMSFLNTERTSPQALLPEARSIIAVALPYGSLTVSAGGAAEDLPADPQTEGPVEPARAGSPRGLVAGYARGPDYHTVMRGKLAELAVAVSEIAGRPVATRACVDTAPLLEREVARRAGLAFVGKSALAIVPGLGSRFVLGELLTDLELAPSTPARPRCGRCTACLDACPTRALVAPYTVDTRRCIAALTLRHTASIPQKLRPLMGVRVAGCDACQDACPYNRGRQQHGAQELAPLSRLSAPQLSDWLLLGSGAYRRLVHGTALAAVSRNQLARNAAIALGNAGDARAVGPLVTALSSHVSPIVRAHAAWALGRFATREAREALAQTLARADEEPAVQEEAKAALERHRG